MKNKLLKFKSTFVFFTTTTLFIHLMHVVALAADSRSVSGVWNGRNTEMPLDLLD